eukprot:1852478-Rhodomonas_salina.2
MHPANTTVIDWNRRQKLQIRICWKHAESSGITAFRAAQRVRWRRGELPYGIPFWIRGESAGFSVRGAEQGGNLRS